MSHEEITIGTPVVVSPVGPGIITGVSDAGYPQVNDVSVTWFIIREKVNGEMVAWKATHFTVMCITVDALDGVEDKARGVVVKTIDEALEVFEALKITEPKVTVVIRNDKLRGTYTLPFAKYSSEGPGIITTDSDGVPNINGQTPIWFIHDEVYTELMDWGKSTYGYTIVIDRMIPPKQEQSSGTIYVTNNEDAAEVELLIGQFAKLIENKMSNKQYYHFPYQRLSPKP